MPCCVLELRGELIAAAIRVIDSGRFLFGPDVAQLEQSIAKLCGVEHAIACASGSEHKVHVVNDSPLHFTT